MSSRMGVQFKSTLNLVCCCQHTSVYIIFRNNGIKITRRTQRLAYVYSKGIQGHDISGGMKKSNRINIPPNRRLIGSKWVFKKKRDGRFRACLVAWGYTKITGVYFTNNYSPLVADLTLRGILLIWFIDKWDS